MKPVDLRLQSSEPSVRETLDHLRRALAPLGLDTEEHDVVELVLAEALNNIVEHAFPDDHPSGTIRISVAHRDNGLHVRIVDDGAPMPGGKPPLGKRQPIGPDISRLPEGGFGWFLIYDLARDVHYRRLERHNQLDLRFAIAMERNR